MAYAQQAEFEVIRLWKVTVSGVKENLIECQKVMDLNHLRWVDAVLVTEVTR